jgi:transcription elongation factor Elf1
MRTEMMRILEFIRDRARYYNCPVCGQSLEGCDVRMLKAVEDRFTVQMTCGACMVQFIVVLAVQGESAETEHAAAEVDDADAVRAAAPDPIMADDVLDVHLLLRDFSGSLTDLIQQPSAR